MSPLVIDEFVSDGWGLATNGKLQNDTNSTLGAKLGHGER
jgi:hypothetical protein